MANRWKQEAITILNEKYKNVDKGYSKHKLATARPQYICNILIVENENAPETKVRVI